MHLRRRNNEHVRVKRNNRKFKTAETFCSIFGTYLKIFAIWALVMMLDFFIDFRFEFLWSCWLFICTVSESFRYEGLAFALFFSLIAVTSDLFCYFLVPTSLVYLLGSSFVWIQLVWQVGGGGALTAVGADRGVYGLTVALCFLFVYVEIAVRLRDPKSLSLGIDLCRPFAAHCIGYPVVTLGFSLKSMILHQFRTRLQQNVGAQNMTYFTLLDEACLLNEGKDYEAVVSDETEKLKRLGSVDTCQIPALPQTRGTSHSNHVTSSATTMTGKEKHRKTTVTTTPHVHHNHHTQQQQQQQHQANSNKTVMLVMDSTSTPPPGATCRNGGGGSGNQASVETVSGGTDDLVGCAGLSDESPSESRQQQQQRSGGVRNPACNPTPLLSSAPSASCNSGAGNLTSKNCPPPAPPDPAQSLTCATCSVTTSFSEAPVSSPPTTATAAADPAEDADADSADSSSNSRGIKSVAGKGSTATVVSSGSSSSTGAGSKTVSSSSGGGKHANKDEYTLKLEGDVRGLRSELASLRPLEMDLRDQVLRLTMAERACRAELSQARQESESLQTKLRQLTDRLQADKANTQAAEKRLAEEQKQRTSLEQQLLQLQQQLLQLQQQQQQQQQNTKQAANCRNKHGVGNHDDAAVGSRSSGGGHTRVPRGTLANLAADGPFDKSVGHRENGGSLSNGNNNSSSVCGDSSCASRIKQLQSELDSLLAVSGVDTASSSKKSTASAKETSRNRPSPGGSLPNGVAATDTASSSANTTTSKTNTSECRTTEVEPTAMRDTVTSELSYKLALLQEENLRLTNTLKNENQMKQELMTVYHTSLKEITDLNAKLTKKEYQIVELNMRLEYLTPRMCDYVNRLNASVYPPVPALPLASSTSCPSSSPSPPSLSNSSSTTTATFCLPPSLKSLGLSGLAENPFFSQASSRCTPGLQLDAPELTGVGGHLVIPLEEPSAHPGNGFRLTTAPPPPGGVLSFISSAASSASLCCSTSTASPISCGSSSCSSSTALVGTSGLNYFPAAARLMNGTSSTGHPFTTAQGAVESGGLGKPDHLLSQQHHHPLHQHPQQQHRGHHAHNFFTNACLGSGKLSGNARLVPQQYQQQQAFSTLSPVSISSAADTFFRHSSANFHSGLPTLLQQQHDLAGPVVGDGNRTGSHFGGDNHRRHQAPGSYNTSSSNNNKSRFKEVAAPTGNPQSVNFPFHHQHNNQSPVSPPRRGELTLSPTSSPPPPSSSPLEQSSLHVLATTKPPRPFPIGYSAIGQTSTASTTSSTHSFDISSGSLADSLLFSANIGNNHHQQAACEPTSANDSVGNGGGGGGGSGGLGQVADEQLRVSKASLTVDSCQPPSSDASDVTSAVSQAENS